MSFHLFARAGYPDFLDLTWDLPLAQWRSDRLVEVPIGVHRYVVRFVHVGNDLFALMELPASVAHEEYRLRRELALHAIPSVELVGVVTHLRSSSRVADLDDRSERARSGALRGATVRTTIRQAPARATV